MMARLRELGLAPRPPGAREGGEHARRALNFCGLSVGI